MGCVAPGEEEDQELGKIRFSKTYANIDLFQCYNYLPTYLPNYPTAWIKVVLEELILSQLTLKFSEYYGTPKVQYRIQYSPPLVSILTHIMPVYAL